MPLIQFISVQDYSSSKYTQRLGCGYKNWLQNLLICKEKKIVILCGRSRTSEIIVINELRNIKHSVPWGGQGSACKKKNVIFIRRVSSIWDFSLNKNVTRNIENSRGSFWLAPHVLILVRECEPAVSSYIVTKFHVWFWIASYKENENKLKKMWLLKVVCRL